MWAGLPVGLSCRGKAHVGPLNVGWLVPHVPDQTMRELRIHGLGDRQPVKENRIFICISTGILLYRALSDFNLK